MQKSYRICTVVYCIYYDTDTIHVAKSQDGGCIRVVAGAPIFTYTHKPDDNEIHNGCKTMLYYVRVRGALCKHTIMSFPICQYTGEVVIFVVYSFLTSSIV